jgi:hypothetical protein
MPASAELRRDFDLCVGVGSGARRVVRTSGALRFAVFYVCFWTAAAAGARRVDPVVRGRSEMRSGRWGSAGRCPWLGFFNGGGAVRTASVRGRLVGGARRRPAGGG